METTLGILVYPHKAKVNKKGEAPLIGRITVNNKRAETALKIKILPEKWDNIKGKAKGNKEDARIINHAISKFRNKITQIYHRLINDDEIFDAELIKMIYLGQDKSTKSIVNQFDQMILRMQERINIDYSPSTIEKYQNTLKHIKEYLQFRYQVRDKTISKLDHQFIDGFEHYLLVHAQQAQSSVYKHIQRFRKSITNAIAEGVIEKDPFFGFHTSKGKSEREFLTKDELERIQNKEFKIARIREVRDVFVFSCYTGIAWVDVTQLTKDNIIIGIDGSKWISGYRQKTKSRYSVPLLPQASEIIEKYQNHPKVLANNTLLPLITAQRTNSYLKEIADLCEISKTITFHVARHTFATTVTLTNGVPIETVSKMLGHTNITTTQIYSKVVQQKVSEDMNRLKSKLSS